MAATVNQPVSHTQIYILRVSPDVKLDDQSSDAGRAWADVLQNLETSQGYKRLYWGFSLEHPHILHLHVVRAARQDHNTYLQSASYASIQSSIKKLTQDPITIRHTSQTHFTPLLSPLHAPVSGTAVYHTTTPGLWDAAWNLWTHIVPTVDGCRGIMGGYVEEDVAGTSRGYLVYVGWESVEKHDAFHHTERFAREGIVLGIGNEGWKEYGHVKFVGFREGAGSKL